MYVCVCNYQFVPGTLILSLNPNHNTHPNLNLNSISEAKPNLDLFLTPGLWTGTNRSPHVPFLHRLAYAIQNELIHVQR